jgi:hypothetical protein
MVVIRTHACVGGSLSLAPLLNSGGADVVTAEPALLCSLYVAGSRDGVPRSCGPCREEPSLWDIPRCMMINCTTIL